MARLVHRLRPIAVAAAVALAAASPLACSSGNGKRSRQVPQGWMGVLATAPVGGADRPFTDRQLSAMSSVGVESLRVPLYWREGQPAGPGPVDFSPYDPVVAAAARHRIDVLPSVLGVPGWARLHPADPASSPARSGDFAAFMAALVGRYGPHGTFWARNPGLPVRPIRVWQVWNEPSQVKYWAEQPYYRRYVALLAAARAAIRGRDPGARVLLAGLVGRSWDQLEAIYRAGGGRDFDYIGVHPFTRRLPDVLRILRYTRAVARRHGDAAKPMVVTELTWPSSAGRIARPTPFDQTEAGQARLLREAFAALAARRGSLGIRNAYWATWTSSDTSRTDAFDYTGLSALGPGLAVRHKPAYAAYRAAARRLEGGG